MAWNADDLELIEAAIATGAKSVTFGAGPSSRTVVYNSIDELLRIRAMMRKSLGMDASRSNTVFVAHSRGMGLIGSGR